MWELKVWDPTPLCLRTFCLFSPGHVLVYWLFLPLDPLDPRPSITVVKTLVLAALLSLQLTILQSSFSQLSKDSAVIHKEVQNEYDTKFVRPTIYKPVRDVGTQILSPGETHDSLREVLAYTPRTYVNRGFQTNPNPNYSQHYDPDGNRSSYGHSRMNRAVTTPIFQTPSVNGSVGVPSPAYPNTTPAMRQPNFRSSSAGVGGGDGGNFGVYSHANSPLKKTAPLSSAAKSRLPAGAEGLRQPSPGKRQGSPLKQSTTPGGPGAGGEPGLQHRFSQLRGDGVKRQSGKY